MRQSSAKAAATVFQMRKSVPSELMKTSAGLFLPRPRPVQRVMNIDAIDAGKSERRTGIHM
ncbi:MAG: hypothetical protein R3D43_07915 [Tepidamorphaceae bacterium]